MGVAPLQKGPVARDSAERGSGVHGVSSPAPYKGTDPPPALLVNTYETKPALITGDRIGSPLALLAQRVTRASPTWFPFLHADWATPSPQLTTALRTV